MARARRKSTGFTLIELLLVVAIIALLVAIILPSITRARAQARLVFCQSSVRQLVFGFNMYSNGNAGRLPGSSHDLGGDWLGFDNRSRITGGMPGRAPEDGTVYKMLGQQKHVYSCPEDARPALLPRIGGWFYSYTMNAMLSGIKTELLSGAHHPLDRFNRTDHTNEMQAFTGVPLIVEPIEVRIRTNPQYPGDVEDRFLTNDCLTSRHLQTWGRKGLASVGYTDGHADRVQLGGLTPEEQKKTSNWQNSYFSAQMLCVRSRGGRWFTGRCVNVGASTYGLIDYAPTADVGLMQYEFDSGKTAQWKWDPIRHMGR